MILSAFSAKPLRENEYAGCKKEVTSLLFCVKARTVITLFYHRSHSAGDYTVTTHESFGVLRKWQVCFLHPARCVEEIALSLLKKCNSPLILSAFSAQPPRLCAKMETWAVKKVTSLLFCVKTRTVITLFYHRSHSAGDYTVTTHESFGVLRKWQVCFLHPVRCVEEIALSLLKK